MVDSNKCISYLTIENKNEIDPAFKGKFDKWIFGCDICQNVCPWNIKFSNETNIHYFKSNGIKSLSLIEVQDLSNREFKRKYKNSPLQRAGKKGIIRNIDFIS